MVDFLSRRVWYGMLWFMRRPPIRRMQRSWVSLVPEKRRSLAWASFIAQEKWAREHGLGLIRLMVLVVLASAGLTLAWTIVLELFAWGIIPTDLTWIES